MLTGLTLAYTNNDYIADKIFQRVPVTTETFKYKKYLKSLNLQVPDTLVGDTGEPNEVKFEFEKLTETVDGHSLIERIPQTSKQEAAAENEDIMTKTTNFLTNVFLGAREKRIADMLQDINNYDGNYKILTANEKFTKDNVDAFDVVDDACDKVWFNQYTDTVEVKAPSAVAAGLRVYLNKNRNIAKSLDNTVCKTVKGLEYPVEFILNKENTESNALNGAGITTFINYKGSYRIFGARNCAYPSKIGIETFDSVIDTKNHIEKTIENSSFYCIGEPITRAFIDNVLETINAKFNEWKNPANQIILGGNAWFDESLNTASQIANGKIRFSYKFCPPSVAEEIEYYSYVDINIITQALSNAD